MRGLFVVVVLIATLVSQGTAQLPFGPEFYLSQYQATEGGQVVVCLSAPILTRPRVPAFTGSIEVNITAEDLPSGDPRQNALFGSDYIVNRQNPSSRTFTVTFQSKQANSTENVILVADDSILEGTEAFRLRIVAARFIGQAADIFRDRLSNTIVDVIIEDNDFVEVRWIISEPIEVTEGEGVRLELYAQAFGLYATPIEVGVVCAEVIATGVPPAIPDRDFLVLSGSTLEFTNIGTTSSTSRNKVVLSIINDDIAEPCESLICTLQGDAVDRVRGVEPNRVTVRICDDDELTVYWARDVYEFDESQKTGTVELVINSTFKMAYFSIQGFPRQIPDGDPNRFPSFVVPGPCFPGTGFAFDATIERVFVRVPSLLFGDRIFGNAQVTQSGRSDVVNTINYFTFTPNSISSFENFTIVDDDVLEFDEIFIAQFSFGPEIANNWNTRQVEPVTAFILIRDDDCVEVNFNENSYTVAESDGQVSVSLRIDGQFFYPVWAVVEISDGTATDPEDYTSAMVYNMTFCQTVFTDGDVPADTASSSPILIDITNDDIFEGVEYFQARIVETSDRFRVKIGQDTVNVTITDSVTVQYEEVQYCADEEIGYVTLALVLDREASVPVTVTVRTLDLLNGSYGDAATASDDYIPTGPFDITFQPGSRRELFNVTIVDDGIPENLEFFNADIVSAGPAGVIIGEPRQPVIEIWDRVDEHVVDPEFHLSQYYATEGGQVVVRLSAPILTRVPAFTGSIEVDITAEDLPSGDPRQNALFGSDYLVNRQNPSSRTFTVTFQSKQANSTENVILVADDGILEGTEAFRLRIVAARFIGQAADIFRDGSTNTVADVIIEDDDFVEVRWIISEPIEVTEGEGVRLELLAQAFGLYAIPIEIGVVCAEVIATGVPPAIPDRDFVVLSGSTLEFTDIGTTSSTSSNKVVLSIINDDIAEPCESLICTLQGGAVDRVRGVEPNRVTVSICDDDELIVYWAREVYEFDESQKTGTVELVINSTFEVAYLSIQGFPRQIPDGDPNRFPSLVVPGPSFPGFAFDATIERVFVRVPSLLFGDRIFGNAQVTQSGRSDVVNTIHDFTFSPNSISSFENFTIVDDDVLEFDEIFIAQFSFGPEIANYWNTRQVKPITAFVLIRDDDCVEVNFNENSYTVAESDGQVSVSLRIDGQFFYPVWAVVEISDGTATESEDYTSAMRYNLTFRQTAFTGGNVPAKTALSSPIVIDITNDDIFEGVEYFQARIVETSDRFRVKIGQDTVNVTITDSVTVQYEEVQYCVDEEIGYVTPALVLDGEASVPVTVTVRALDLLNSSYGDAATASDDYIPTGPFDITFQPGSRRELFNVTIVDDGIPENLEFFNADIVSAGPAGVIIGEPRQPVIEIWDRVDDPPPCTYQNCRKNKVVLCTRRGPEGKCTNQVTSCKACYFASEERPLPDKCSTNRRKYRCVGLTGRKQKACLQRWANCLKNEFKDTFGKTRRRMRKEKFFKCPGYPWN